MPHRLRPGAENRPGAGPAGAGRSRGRGLSRAASADVLAHAVGTALAGASAAAFIGLAWPPAAAAHAVLVRADPPSGALLGTAPAEVRLLFSEPVEPVGRGIRVLAPTGRRVDRGSVSVSGPAVAVSIEGAGEGSYQVRWRVISRDTHPDSGAIVFSVGRATPPAAAPGGAEAAGLGLALAVTARVLHFAGYALGFGALTVHTVAARGSGGAAGVWRLVGLGVVALLVAEPLALAGQAVILGAVSGSAVDPEVVGSILDSSFGRVFAQRLGAALLLWVLAAVLRERAAAPSGPPSGATGGSRSRHGRLGGGWVRDGWLVPVVGLGLAVVDGEAAHAVSARPVWLGMTLNAVHVAAMGAWAGGLALLLTAGPGAHRPAWPNAAWIVAALVMTGGAMAVQHLPRLGDLAGTPYGRVLLAKIAVLALIAWPAWRAWRSDAAAGARWWRREAAVLLGVLGLAGLLVSLRPPV